MKNNEKKLVVILSYNHYPEGDAGAVRDMIFAQMYSLMGYRVICIGKGTEAGFVNDIEYISAFEDVSGLKQKLLQTRKYVSFVKNILKNHEEDIEIIHILDIPLSLIQYIKRQKNAWQLIHDSVEWYSACEFKLGKLSRAYIHKEILNRYVINKKFKVISISRFLYDYYVSKSINTIRIPVLMELPVSSPKRKKDKSKERNILYAGSPAKKDCLDIMLKGVKLLREDERRLFKFHIVGVNEKQLEQYISKADYEELKDVLIVHGRRSRDYVLEMLNQADFTVLVRLNERYANAGFSTKVVESLANGVPIICNLTSDMDLFLEDGKNAICLNDASGEAFCEGLRKYVKMDEKSILSMQCEARKTAEAFFRIDLYCTLFENFLMC